MKHFCDIILICDIPGYVIQKENDSLKLILKYKTKKTKYVIHDIEIPILFCPICGEKTKSIDSSTSPIISKPYVVTKAKERINE